MTLAATQQGFMAQVLSEDAPLPQGWGERHQRGINVYRGNYRSALVEALRNTYERTLRWVGEEAFTRAATHHLIVNPPSSWTIDDAGMGFDATCAELFTENREVAELAWLEWAMLEAFVAADEDALDGARFAQVTSGFGDSDWAEMRLRFVCALTIGTVHHDLPRLWKALASEEFERFDSALEEPMGCLVWREGERSTFKLVEPREAALLSALVDGASFGDGCMVLAETAADQESADPQAAASEAGAMLGSWLQEGLIAALEG